MSLIAQVVAPPSWRRLAFASDLHLGPEAPATQAAFLRALERLQADALFLLGDVMEAWVGDDGLSQTWATDLAQGLRRWSERRPLFFQAGNRDFLLGPAACAALGAKALAEVTTLDAFGQRAVLVHGDAQCLEDTAYQAFRAQVRSPAWQAQFLAQPLAQRLALAAQMRAASRTAQAEGPYGDLDDTACNALLREHGATVLLHGHTHRPATHPLAGGTRWVLSDWDLDHAARSEWLLWEDGRWQREAAGC